jgi:hypothetical protein
MDDLDDSGMTRPPPLGARSGSHASQVGRGRPVVWGLPDAGLCWLIGIVGGGLAAVPAVMLQPAGTHALSSAVTFLIVLPTQNLTMLAGLWWVSRTKGLGTWAADFGLQLRRRDADAFLIGIGLQLLLSLASTPLSRLTDRPTDQALVRLIGDTTNVFVAVGIVASTVVVAPLVEELLFRGLLLRSLLRRLHPTAAVAIGGILFGGVHLLDARALLAVPALTVLGVTLNAVALRTHSLSRPILMHAGFNLAATVAALAT